MRKESDTGIFNCLICKEDKTSLAIGECEHRRVCLYCSMKSRLLYKDIKCPVCNAKQDYIYIVNNTDYISYADLVKNKDMYYLDDDFGVSGIYYTTIQAKEEALNLRGFNCPIKRCRSQAFENLQALKTHLENAHKRYYCDCCLKEDKRFLSEMEIYAYDQLMDHTQYGEYENGVLIYPPHPSCPFCDSSFYNDESLFKHMNGTHFICQLCKDQKNIIFYSVLENLLRHYKEKHFCCPFQECLEDIYVVFEREEELISHMVTKHKVTNASERLTQLLLDSNKNNKSSYSNNSNKRGFNKGNSNYLIKDQFHFTQYINEIKLNSEKYLRDLEKQKRYVQTNDKDNYYNSNSNSNNAGYYYDNNNNQRKGGGGGNRGKRRGGNNQGYDYYNSNNQYYNNSNNNKYDRSNKQNPNPYYQEIEVEVTSNPNSNNANFIQQQEPEQQQSQQKQKKQINPHQSSKLKDIDYSFVFNFFLKFIKDYLKNKIISDKTPEEQFILPKETIYQLIIIIDKFDSFHKMYELTALHTFGLDINIHKEIKALLTTFSNEEANDNDENVQQSLYKVLDRLSIRNNLILYKYIQIATKKVDGLFYKFDLEQIDSDLYEDFVQRPNNKASNNDKTNLSKGNKGKYNKSNDNDPFPPKSSLNSIFGKEKEKEKEETQTTINSSYTKPKSKLYLLLSSTNQQKEVSGHKVNTGKQHDFKLGNFDLEKDFPPLK